MSGSGDSFLDAYVPIVERTNVVKGFLNILIADGYWIDFLKERYADAAYWSAAAQ